VNVIEFLCPNNHKIRCPDDQAGRAAKCPKCGVKFLIPTNGSTEKVQAEEVVSSGSSMANKMADSHIALGASDHDSTGESSNAIFQPLKTTSSIKTSAATSARLAAGTSAAAPSMAKLFIQLWAEKPKDAVLEIILRNGEVFKPDLFAKKMSLQQQGIFAVKEMDGTYTIIMVSWDALSHVHIRKMRDLPTGFGD
jgi:hypothetical protein